MDNLLNNILGIKDSKDSRDSRDSNYNNHDKHGKHDKQSSYNQSKNEYTKHNTIKKSENTSTFLINPIYILSIHVFIVFILVFIMMYLYFFYRPRILKSINDLLPQIHNTDIIRNIIINVINKVNNFFKEKYNISDLSIKSSKINEDLIDFYTRTGLLILLFIILSIIITYSFWNVLRDKENYIIYKKIGFNVCLMFITSIPLTLFMIHYNAQYLNIDYLDDVYNDASQEFLPQ